MLQITIFALRINYISQPKACILKNTARTGSNARYVIDSHLLFTVRAFLLNLEVSRQHFPLLLLIPTFTVYAYSLLIALAVPAVFFAVFRQ